MRRNLIVFLGFPMHGTLSKLLFYDVLALCCRHAVESSHELIQQRKKEITLSLMVSHRMRN